MTDVYGESKKRRVRMRKEKILKENYYEKIVQTTIIDDHCIVTYTQRYIKVYHKNYKNGYILQPA